MLSPLPLLFYLIFRRKRNRVQPVQDEKNESGTPQELSHEAMLYAPVEVDALVEVNGSPSGEMRHEL